MEYGLIWNKVIGYFLPITKLIKFNKTTGYLFLMARSTSFFICSFGKEGITKAMYGINKDIPDTDYSAHFRFDCSGINYMNANAIDKISIRLFFKDGTKSDIEIFNNQRMLRLFRKPHF